ncbi:MAG: PEP-CTERM sorting domain-containing protein [Planctomycetota bacterium]|nr:PEP-CTERM sorting domain-containing protein [Planctomycetota bacterium]
MSERMKRIAAATAAILAVCGSTELTWGSWDFVRRGVFQGAGYIDTLLACPDGTVYAGTGSGAGVYKTADGGLTWTPTASLANTGRVYDLSRTPNGDIYAAVYGGTWPGGIYRTANGGTTWTRVTTSLPDMSCYSVLGAVNGSVYAGTTNSGVVYRSTNGGTTWGLAATLESTYSIFDFCQGPDGTLYAATHSKVFRSTDGQQWLTGGAFPGKGVGIVNSMVAARDGYLYAGTRSPGMVARSSDGGQTWTPTASWSNIYDVTAVIEASDGAIYAVDDSVTAGGVYRSADHGASWQAMAWPPAAGCPKTVVEGTDHHLYVSTWATTPSFVYRSVEAVPEPASVSLMALAALGLWRRRRTHNVPASRVTPEARNSPRRRGGWFFRAALPLLVLGAAGTAMAVPSRYDVSVVLDTPGYVPYGYAVNQQGTVVGYSQGSAWKKEGGKLTTIGPSDGYRHCWAVNVNDAGTVVGYYEVQSNHAIIPCVWRNGGIEDLDYASATGFALDINTGGQIGGYYYPSTGGKVACLWQANGQRTDLPSLGGTSELHALNDAGVAVGDSCLTAQSSPYRATVWENGTVRALSTLGGNNSLAYDINEQGTVVGYAEAANGVPYPVMWDSSGQITRLATTSRTYANAVNNRNQIVGLNDSAGYGFLYQDSTMYQLSDLVTGWQITNAVDINDQGQILARSGRTILLLTPTPEPATLSLLAVGTLVVIRKRRK